MSGRSVATRQARQPVPVGSAPWPGVRGKRLEYTVSVPCSGSSAGQHRVRLVMDEVGIVRYLSSTGERVRNCPAIFYAGGQSCVGVLTAIRRFLGGRPALARANSWPPLLDPAVQHAAAIARWTRARRQYVTAGVSP